jgi:YCII-related domain
VAKFMVLYRSSVSAQEQMASASPEQAQAGMEMWMRWAEKVGPAMVDMGSPLGPSRSVPSGAHTETGSTIAGFSILEADSADDVVALLDDHPHLQAPGAAIEVLEYLEMPGM